MDTAKSKAFPPPVPTVPPPIDPLMHERLARLTASRSGRDGATRIPPAAKGTKTTAPTSSNRKRHPAKGSRTAAVLMSLATTAGLAAYFQRVDSASATDGASTLSGTATASGAATTATTATTAAASSASTTPATTASPASTAATTATTAPATTAATASVSGLADGTYAGATSTNRWGPVQVQITVSGGQITQSVALQTPYADRKSVSINSRATPKLAAEVLSAQTAKIDTVSGATYTSKSYRASLQSAIDLARATAAQAGASS